MIYETTTTCGIHLSNFARPEINVETQESASRPDGYPVLHIGPAVFWPTAEQLGAIRDAIDGWLASPDGIRLADRRQPAAIC
jgi:hypothetical protein